LVRAVAGIHAEEAHHTVLLWVAMAATLALMGCGIGAIALVRRSFI
jgi:hypothetical protein